MRTHGACNTVSGPMVTQPLPDVQASVRTLVCQILAPPPAAAPKCADWGSNRRPHGCRPAALPLGHYLDSREGPPCCLGPYLLLTKNPNCVYLSDCLLAGSGTDWLTVNLSSRCTAEGNRICGKMACDPCRYTLSGICGHSKAITNKRVFCRYHILVYEVWICRTSRVRDMYQSRPAQEVYITSGNHAPSIQGNLHIIGHTSYRGLSRLSYSDAATNNINLECQLV